MCLITTIFFTSMMACSVSYIPSNKSRESSGNYYLFNPDTILTDLAQGKTDLFIEKDGSFDPPLSEPVKVVQWSQGDYFRIAQAVHERFWNDAFSDWKLGNMYFTADCHQVEKGPQKGSFGLYRIIEPFFEKSGLEELIVIDPSPNSIWRSNKSLDPQAMPSVSIDFPRLRVTANNAFQMAEDNGGKGARLANDNNCFATALLAPNGGAKDWDVSYHNKDQGDIFSIKIDEYTGMIK